MKLYHIIVFSLAFGSVHVSAAEQGSAERRNLPSISSDECERLRSIGVPCEKIPGQQKPAQVDQSKNDPVPVSDEQLQEIERQLTLNPDVELLYWNGEKFEPIGKNWENYLNHLINQDRMQKFTVKTGLKLFGMDVKIGGATWKYKNVWAPPAFHRQYVLRVELIR